jgi:hypothetical protein
LAPLVPRPCGHERFTRGWPELKRRLEAPRKRPEDTAPRKRPEDTAPRKRPEDTAVEAALTELGLSFENPRPGAFLVRLEGQHKLATMTWLVVGEHSLGVESFFCRQPDENHEVFYRFLLERNGRMYGVHFTLDPVGDVYLTGRLPLGALTVADIDRLLGCVLSYSDDNFDTALELGFASAIRREWAWRAKRGESLANLRAFARFADPDRPGSDPGPGSGSDSAPDVRTGSAEP